MQLTRPVSLVDVVLLIAELFSGLVIVRSCTYVNASQLCERFLFNFSHAVADVSVVTIFKIEDDRVDFDKVF